MSDQFKAIILGLVEGLTEFIPVSSTGHLIITGKALEFSGDLAESFDIVIQLGAILAVVFLYRDRFISLIPRDTDYTRQTLSGLSGLLKIAASCLPMLLLGLIFHKKIKLLLFHPIPVAISLILGGIIMLIVEKLPLKTEIESIDQLSFKKCFILGIFQCAALWPGMSRSGSMIVGGLLSGLNKKSAAEFSFLVAVPMMCAASGLEILKNYQSIKSSDFEIILLGFIVAFVSAVIAIKGFLKLLNFWSLKPFAIYRIILGILVISWQF